MNPTVKIVPCLKFKELKLGKLITQSERIPPVSRAYFGKRFGNILDLLTTNVDMEALIALEKYYDPPLRCFTFQDFQLVPTIEEFERILNWPLKDDTPFLNIGQDLDKAKVAAALFLPVREVAPWITGKGILRQNLEDKLLSLSVQNTMILLFDASHSKTFSLFLQLKSSREFSIGL